MERSRRTGAAIAATLVVFGVAAVGAYAGAAGRAAGRHPVAAAVSAALGIPPRQLAADLRSGQTLAQIAAASGKPLASVEQAIVAGVRTRLDRAVAAGHLTSAAEQSILSGLGARLDALANAKHPVAHVLLGHRLRAAIARLSAGYLQLSPQQLRASLQSGQTLAELATAQGESAAGLEQAVEAAVGKRLDAAGHLSAQGEQALHLTLQKRLDALVNRTFAP